MTPHTQSKDGVGDGHNGTSRTRHRQRDARSRIFRELVHIAAAQGASISLGVSTGDALQECLDRAVALWRFAAEQVDNLDVSPDPNVSPEEDGFFEVMHNPQGPDIVTPSRWYLMEREARLEIEKLAAMMTQLGIAERVVRVEEAKAALLVAATQEAAMDIGLDHDTVRALGAALRNRVLGQQDKTPIHRTKEAIPTLRESEVIEASLDDAP